MTDGLIVEWLVPSGAHVDVGQPIYRLETDKAVVEIASPVAGVLRQIGVVNAPYPIGTVIAEVG